MPESCWIDGGREWNEEEEKPSGGVWPETPDCSRPFLLVLPEGLSGCGCPGVPSPTHRFVHCCLRLHRSPGSPGVQVLRWAVAAPSPSYHLGPPRLSLCLKPQR